MAASHSRFTIRTHQWMRFNTSTDLPMLGLQKKRPICKKKKRGSFLKAVLAYLRSDSYMYGPLVSGYPSRRRPAYELSSGMGRIHSAPAMEVPILPKPQQAAASTPSMLTTTSTRPIEVITEEAKKFIDLSRSTNEYLKEQLSPEVDLAMYRNVLPDTPLTGKRSEEVKGNETPAKGDNLSELEHDSPSYSATESYTTDDEFLPLAKDTADEVVQRLVKRLGGRYSKELGIYVDICDSEVERWFLAASLITSPRSFEASKQMFKKLQNRGISQLLDILTMDQNELAELFEMGDFNIHKHRIASRLLRLANGLHKQYGGHICFLKHNHDYVDLKRELHSLPGLGLNASRTFLRELRGIWPGANPDVDKRTKNAAKHLHLLSKTLGGKAVDHSETWLAIKNLSEGAGLDVRDVELALFKLGLEHAHQYRYCSGGSECRFLPS